MANEKRNLINMDNKVSDFSVIKKIDGRESYFENNVHYHKFIEMNFIADGKTSHEINGENTVATRGYVAIIMPHDYHTYHTEVHDTVTIYNVCFFEKWISNDVMIMLNVKGKKLEAQLNEQETQILIKIYEFMIKEYEEKNAFSDIAISRLLDYAILFVLRKIDDVNHTENTSVINAIISSIEKNFQKADFSLLNVSEELNITPNYIGSLLCKHTNMSFPQYLNKRRLVYAEKLLREDLALINDIALKAGFNSTSYFIKKFKNMYGLSPKAYRENYSKGGTQ